VDSGLRGGGVVQLLELNVEFTTDDNSVPKGGYIERYQKAYNEAAKQAGLKNPVAELGDYLRGAGFVDVAVAVRKLPVGPWAKDPQKKVSLSHIIKEIKFTDLTNIDSRSMGLCHRRARGHELWACPVHETSGNESRRCK
jgi:hypothetical protein